MIDTSVSSSRDEQTIRPTESATASMQRPGLYGFALELDEPDESISSRLTPAPARWPVLHVNRTVASRPGHTRVLPPEGELRMDDHCATIELPGGQAVMRRESHEACFTTPRALTADELVHPMLGHAALAFSHWMGRECFHAGVLLGPDGAWALLGERGAGKSSTLAWLVQNGYAIVADDLLILEDRIAFVGPRTIDLAAPSASHLGWGAELEHVRGGLRQRLPLAALAPQHRLMGWVSLVWADEVGIVLVPAADRLPLLAGHGHHPLGKANWPNLLSLAALPMFELQRPKRLESLGAAAQLLLDTIAATGQV
jgi:hypothetical protein